MSHSPTPTAPCPDRITSPDGSLSAAIWLDAEGPMWSLSCGGTPLVLPSRLGLDFACMPPLGPLAEAERSVRTLAEDGVEARELTVTFAEAAAPARCRAARRFSVVLRVYDDGAAFRYVVPEQPDIPGFQLTSAGERTEWRFPEGTRVWTSLYDSHLSSQEKHFEPMDLASIDASQKLGTPVLVETGGRTVALAEAALVNWAGLLFRHEGTVLSVDLAPLPPSGAALPDVAVIRQAPAASPWRVALVGTDALDLIRRKGLIPRLNPPPEPGQDFSWVRPGVTGWDWWVESNNSLSTELTLRLVDFAAEMGWAYHTIDAGWYGFAPGPNHGPDVRIEPAPGFDLARIVAHAAEKGVGIWVWLHWEALHDNGEDETLARLASWGVKGIKIDFHDRQDQWMVRWFETVCRLAARHRIMVNFHGAFKPTGTERTWPNNLTREGILGNEYYKFSRSGSARHVATLPFTRYLLGPGDFTPGSFGNVHARDFVPQCEREALRDAATDPRSLWADTIGTRAHELALCVAFDSPLMTLCDWPDRYRGAEGAEALRALPAVWKATRPLAGECGEYYAVAREAEDGRVYVAAYTVAPRRLDLALDFLGEGEWRLALYADDPARTPADATAVRCETRTVRRGDTLSLDLLEAGGAVAILTRADA